MLFEAAVGQAEELDEQGQADPLRGVHPLLVEGVEPGVWILSLIRAEFPAASSGLSFPAAAPHRDVAELDSEHVRGDRMDRPAGTGRRAPWSPPDKSASSAVSSARSRGNTGLVPTRSKAMPRSLPR